MHVRYIIMVVCTCTYLFWRKDRTYCRVKMGSTDGSPYAVNVMPAYGLPLSPTYGTA